MGDFVVGGIPRMHRMYERSLARHLQQGREHVLGRSHKGMVLSSVLSLYFLD